VKVPQRRLHPQGRSVSQFGIQQEEGKIPGWIVCFEYKGDALLRNVDGIVLSKARRFVLCNAIVRNEQLR
jgi:hypothetical protein